MKLTESDIWTLVICATVIICMSFLSGQSRAMDNQLAAQRLANFCQYNEMNMLCMGVKNP